MSHKSVRDRIVRAFLIEEVKLMKRLMKEKTAATAPKKDKKKKDAKKGGKKDKKKTVKK